MDLAEFTIVRNDERFEIFFSGLLKMKAYLGEEGIAFIQRRAGELKILISFAQPLGNNARISHAGPFPSCGQVG